MKIKNGTIKFSLVISYLAVAFILIVVNLGLYTVYEKVLDKQIADYNEFTAESIAKHIKDVTVNIQELYNNVTALPQMSEKIEAKSIDDYYLDGGTVEFINQLRGTLSDRNESIGFLYIYVENLKAVILESGILEEKIFYNNYVGETVSFEEWKKQIKNTNEFYETELKKVDKDVRVVSYNMPIDKKRGIIFSVAVDNDYFFGEIDDIGWLEKGNALIYDRNGRLLAAKKHDALIAERIEEIETKFSNKTVVYKHLVKHNTMLNYSVLIVPRKVAVGDMLMVRKVFYGINFITLLFLALLIGHYFKKNFRPIREIAKILDTDSDSLDYARLKEIVIKKIDENNIYLKRMESQSEKIKLTELAKFLKGGYGAVNEDGRKDGRYGFDLEEKDLSVILFSYKDISNFFSDYEEMEDNEKYNLLLFIIGNIFEELLKTDKIKVYVMDLDNEIVCVVNYSADDSLFLVEKLNYGIGVIENEYNFKLSYVLSRPRRGLVSLAESYSEVEKANEYKLLFNVEGNIQCSQPRVVEEEGEIKYYFDSEVEKALINHVLSGNYEMAASIIVSCFESIKTSFNPTGEYLRCMVYDIMATIIKATIVEGREQETARLSKILELNISGENIDDVLKQVLEKLKMVCDIIANDANERKMDISARIREFVQKHFEDENMSMTHIGEYFEMAPSYLSRRFKEEYGEALPDYIAKLRVERAKKLMRIQEYTLSTIAGMSGFSNVRTFNRVFKKYENITPTEYRKTNLDVEGN